METEKHSENSMWQQRQLQVKEQQISPANHQKQGRNKEGFSYRCLREHRPVDTLIPDFQTLEPWNNAFVFF